jgi:predicted P-loop ATPase
VVGIVSGTSASRIDVDSIRASYPLADLLAREGVKVRDGSAICPFHAEKSPSFRAYDDGRFHCFGCGAHGDVLDFVQQKYGLGFRESVDWLTGSNVPATAFPARDTQRQDPFAAYEIFLPPEGAPEIAAGRVSPRILNPRRHNEDGTPRIGTWRPTLVHPYRLQDGRLVGYVIRAEVDGRKLTPLVLWAKGPLGWEGWTLHRFREPRLLYGLDRLTPERQQVIVVEGEKAADALQRIVDAARAPIAVMTWQGGTRAVDRARWSVLASRRVVLWPDADRQTAKTADAARRWGVPEGDPLPYEAQPGPIAMAEAARLLASVAQEVKVIDVGMDPDRASGWDAADAEAAGWTLADVLAWSRPRTTVWAAPAPRTEPPAARATTSRAAPSARSGAIMTAAAPDSSPDRSMPSAEIISLADHMPPLTDWRSRLIMNDKGMPKPKLMTNFIATLAHEPSLKGVFGYNEFDASVYVMRRPDWDESSGPWGRRRATDFDLTSAHQVLEHKGFTPKVGETSTAIGAAAMEAKFNPVVDYFNRLQWDGTPRLDTWLQDFCEAADTPVIRAMGAAWMISAVARALRPGAKVDTMLVLEGQQGMKKSTTFRTLATLDGTTYYSSSLGDIRSKDGAMQLHGILILEVGELASFTKADIDSVKDFMTKQVDRFRPPFGKAVQDYPRHCIFGGTVNPEPSGYLNDPTGGRRFWPVRVGRCDVHRLEDARDQLWAEAVARFSCDEPWWFEEPEIEALLRGAQDARRKRDPFGVKIDEYLDALTSVREDQVAEFLGIPKGQWTQALFSRISSHLSRIGWEPVERMLHGQKQIAWRRPRETGAAADVEYESV